jgi:hypothetical protein
MYVILTSKPGEFRTEAAQPGDLQPQEAWDYLFCGRRKAHYVIAEIRQEVKVKVIDETGSAGINLVPTKFLPRFASIEQARAELQALTRFGSLDTQLVPA